MTELDEEFQNNLEEIQEGKANFSEDEQNIINDWIGKLLETKDTDEEKTIRNNYTRTLAKIVKEKQPLVPPFSESPPDGDLIPILDTQDKTKFTYKLRKMPCSPPRGGQRTGAIPKVRKPEKFQPKFEDHTYNEFQDPQEMARVIARSKGQSFADFVVAVSRHTSDYGQELRAAMNSEISSFKEYVDRVLSQRIKDLTEVLDEEQNRELLRIKRDIERWQLELSHVKRRIKEMFPSFDVDLYRKDKNYLKKFFTIETPIGMSPNDSFQKWKDESCHRLKWICEMIGKMQHCNEQTTQELSNVKSDATEMEARETLRQQNFMKHLNCEINEYQKLKAERDRLHKEISEMQAQLRALEE